MKILVLPDIHGRQFWRKPCENVEQYDRVVFLGDYLDPYDFEGISVEDAIDNFKDILLMAKDNDKVVMLLGNHDMPYYSKMYYGFNAYHHRHSTMRHKEICEIFKEYEDRFKVAHVEDDVLFTHAGCLRTWLSYAFEKKYDEEIDLNELCLDINSLLNDRDGLLKLYMYTHVRGGWDPFGSCIWADISETYWDMANILSEEQRQYAIYQVKQIFGHSLQLKAKNLRVVAKEDKNLKLVNDGYEFGNHLEFRNCKMLDNAKAYELDTETFTVKEV